MFVAVFKHVQVTSTAPTGGGLVSYVNSGKYSAAMPNHVIAKTDCCPRDKCFWLFDQQL